MWRDNAACLSTSLDPHADFIYGGGAVSGHGVVLAEAHGSFAQAVTVSRMRGESSRKYRRQVKPYIGKPSTHGTVVHGYSVAFGSHPNSHDTFLHVTETKIAKSRGQQAPSVAKLPRVAPVATSLALASHRSNFLLMGARHVVAWIDWLRDGGERPSEELVEPFLTVRRGGQRFWVAIEALLPYLRSWTWPDKRAIWVWEDFEHWRHLLGGPDNVFVMEEYAAKSFLMALSAMIGSSREQFPPVLELPVSEPSGLFADLERGKRDEDARYPVTQFRDGLALLARLPRIDPPDTRLWLPLQGIG